MPPTPTELEAWWLSIGREALSSLFDRHEDDPKPMNIGFAQYAQSKLRNFDENPRLKSQFREDWLKKRDSGCVEFEPNPRKRLKDSTVEIFKHVRDGGFQFKRAFEGLADIDAAEVHRLKVLGATKETVENLPSGQKSNRVIEELEAASTKRYGQIHLGFRACVSDASTTTLEHVLTDTPSGLPPSRQSRDRFNRQCHQGNGSSQRPFPRQCRGRRL